jgi:hypothetical protein
VFASVGKLDLRADNEVDNCPRHQNLVGFRNCLHPLGEVDSKPSDIIATALHFACMNADSNFQTKIMGGFAYPDSASNRPGRSVEDRQCTVADPLDQAPTKALELAIDGLIMAVELVSPPQIAKFSCTRRRVHDIGEQDGCEQSIRCGRMSRPSQELFDFARNVSLTDPRNMICTREFDIAGAGDVICQVAAVGRSNKSIVTGVHYQRGRTNAGEHWPNIGG